MLALLLALQTSSDPGPVYRGLARELDVAPPRIEAAVRIDGVLDEVPWSRAAVLTGFSQYRPADGRPAEDSTAVLVWYAPDAIYFGIRAFERHGGGLVRATLANRDNIDADDRVQLLLDTYADHRRALLFAVNPLGVQEDGVWSDGVEASAGGPQAGGRFDATIDLNPDFVFESRGRVTPTGYEVEVRIPFKSLRYQSADPQTWGIQVDRVIQHSGYEDTWTPAVRASASFLIQSGRLTGLTGLRRGLVMDITPEVTTKVNGAPGATAYGYTTTPDAGGTLRWGVTENLSLTAAANPDFSQVEADVGQVTANARFPLFFPEKRPFFLENAGVFSAGTPQAVELFFSRRIGIDTLGNPVPIAGGGRLTGKVAGLTVGALQLFTEREAGIQPANSYSVSRVLKEWGRSRIGVLAVHRLATRDGRDRNTTLAADGRLALSDPVTIDWWVAKTNTPGRTGRDEAFSGRLGFKNSRWDNGLRFAQVGEDFNPEVGFLSRSGYRYYEPSVFYTMPLRHRYLRYWLPHISYRGYFGFDGAVQSDWLHLDLGQAELNNGGQIGPEVNIYREGLTQPFDIATGVTLPAGVYHWTSLGFDFGTNPSAPVAFLTKLQAGQFYNGTLYGWTSTTTARGSSLTASLQFDYNRVRLDQGNFVRSLVGLRLGYFFTPRMFVQSLVQYNNQAAVFSANVRFGWLNTAGTGLFVVLNTADTATELFAWRRPMARSLQVKFTRQFGTGG